MNILTNDTIGSTGSTCGAIGSAIGTNGYVDSIYNTYHWQPKNVQGSVVTIGAFLAHLSC